MSFERHNYLKSFKTFFPNYLKVAWVPELPYSSEASLYLN
jgi:hypothetical protein